MSALTRITTRAKQIRRARPGMSWKSAIKQAGAEYRGSKKAKPKKSRSPRAPRKRAKQNKGADTGAGPSPVTAVKAMLRERLGRALLTKEMAKGKLAKRRAQKSVNELRAKLRTAEKL